MKEETNPYTTAPDSILMEERPSLSKFGFKVVGFWTAHFMGSVYYFHTPRYGPDIRLNRFRWVKVGLVSEWNKTAN